MEAEIEVGAEVEVGTDSTMLIGGVILGLCHLRHMQVMLPMQANIRGLDYCRCVTAKQGNTAPGLPHNDRPADQRPTETEYVNAGI